MTENDRRISPRFQAKRASHIVYTEGFGEVRDLSLEGLFVLDPDPLPVDSKITFSLRAGGQEIALNGIVRRSVPDEGMAIQFTNLTSEAKRRLRIHIATLVATPETLPKP